MTSYCSSFRGNEDELATERGGSGGEAGLRDAGVGSEVDP